MLRHHRWLRAVQLVGSQTRDGEGQRRGYDARLIFQSDNLAEQPLELLAREVLRFTLEPTDWLEAEGSGSWSGEACHVRLGQGELLCRELRYRWFEGAKEPQERSSIH